MDHARCSRLTNIIRSVRSLAATDLASNVDYLEYMDNAVSLSETWTKREPVGANMATLGVAKECAQHEEVLQSHAYCQLLSFRSSE